jgi:hypothetical protein
MEMSINNPDAFGEKLYFFFTLSNSFALKFSDDFDPKALQKSSYLSSVLRLGHFGYHLELKAALTLLLWAGKREFSKERSYRTILFNGRL